MHPGPTILGPPPQGGTGPSDDDDGDDNDDDEGDGDDNDTDDEKYIRRPTWQPATAHPTGPPRLTSCPQCTFRFKSKPFFYSFVLLFSTPNLAMLVELTNIVLKQFLILFFLVNFRPSFPSFAILFFSYPLAE